MAEFLKMFEEPQARLQARMASTMAASASAVALSSSAASGWLVHLQTLPVPTELPPNDRVFCEYDSAGRLHCENGPAVRSRSTHLIAVMAQIPAAVVTEELAAIPAPQRKRVPKFQRWFWHGVEVEERVVMSPETITVHEIILEENVELRRVKIERFGQDRFFQECGATLIAKDECGELYVRTFRGGNNNNRMVNIDPWGVETLTFVKVKNSTPEPDGSFKHYYLRVPPETLTPRSGVAWSFGLQPSDYNPQVQT